MGDHALYSPSSAARWLECSASVHLIQHVREQDIQDGRERRSSVAADNGSKLHKRAELLLEEHVYGTVSDVPQRHRNNAQVNMYVNYCVELMRQSEDLDRKAYIEHKCVITDDLWGTADFVLVEKYERGTRVHVVDFKTGAVFVDAYKNPQLMLYAGAFRKGTKFALHIVQPLYGVSTYRCSGAEVQAFIERAKAATRSFQFTPSQAACQYCDASARCQAYNINKMREIKNVI